MKRFDKFVLCKRENSIQTRDSYKYLQNKRFKGSHSQAKTNPSHFFANLVSYMFSVKQWEIIFDKRSTCSCIVSSEKYYGCFPKYTGVIYWAIFVVSPRAEPRMKNISIKTCFFRMVQWHFWGLGVGKKFKCHVWALELFQSILVPVFESFKCKQENRSVSSPQLVNWQQFFVHR